MENIWKEYNEEKLNAMEGFCNDYKKFISDCKTERECIDYTIKLAEQNGFINLDDALEQNKKLSAGDKVYSVNMGKAMMLMVIGSEPMVKGMNFVGSHVDSPRLDLKAKPIYENNGLCLFDTHYYGGIKKYPVQRGKVRMYEGEKALEHLERIELVDQIISGKPIDEATTKPKKDIMFCYCGEDWYVTVDSKGNIGEYVMANSTSNIKDYLETVMTDILPASAIQSYKLNKIGLYSVPNKNTIKIKDELPHSNGIYAHEKCTPDRYLLQNLRKENTYNPISFRPSINLSVSAW